MALSLHYTCSTALVQDTFNSARYKEGKMQHESLVSYYVLVKIATSNIFIKPRHSQR